MLEKLFMSIFYVLPICGASYTLFGFFLRNSATSDTVDEKPNVWKNRLSLAGAVASAVLAFLWLMMIWFPDIHFPLFVKIVFFILFIPFGCLLALIGGLGNAVEAGAGSAGSVIKEVLNMLRDDKPNTDKKA